MYSVNICRDINGFRDLRENWDFLIDILPNKSIFLTWEWLFSWWEHFGQKRNLFIILVWDKEGVLVGIAPLFIHKTKYYYFPVREITFIGVGHSDRQDFLIKNNDPKILSKILYQLMSYKNEWDIINLDQIPPGSILLTGVCNNNFDVFLEHSSICPFIKIQGRWEDYFNSLSYKFRRDLKNRTNKLNKSGSWEFRVKTSLINFRDELEKLVTIESKSRKTETQKTFLSKSENLKFLYEFFQFGAQKNWLDLTELSLNSALIAYLIGFRFDNHYYAYNMAFDENFMEVSPGKILFQEKIKWCFQNYPQIQEFDLLRGDSYIKSKWTADNRQHYRVIFFNKKLYTKIIRYIVIIIKRLRKKIMRLFLKFTQSHQ
mgnify:CR=1 FL=1